jgi:hypothetical protein
MALAASGPKMVIDVNEGEINGDMKGRDFSPLLQVSDTSLGRRGLPEE